MTCVDAKDICRVQMTSVEASLFFAMCVLENAP
jgi:hypothetical protein